MTILRAIGNFVRMAGLSALTASCDDGAGALYPPSDVIEGIDMAELVTAYHRIVTGEPVATNPVLDMTGAECALGDRGADVHFAFGSFGGGGPIERRCTVSRDRLLVLPIVDWLNDNVGRDPAAYLDVAALRDGANAIVDTYDSATLEIDGVSFSLADLAAYRRDTVLTYDVPTTYPNVYDYFGVTNTDGSRITGLVDPAVDVGYWVVIRPLSPGMHTIRVTNYSDNNNADPSDDFYADVTTILTVE